MRLLRAVLFILLCFSPVYCYAREYRIVSLAPNTTEILFKLGLGESVVGVDEYSNYPEEVKYIERVGTFVRPNIEKIILLKPDYILINADLNYGVAHYLENLGITILKVAPENLNQLCACIERLGYIFHKENEAGLIVGDIQSRIDEISKNINGRKPKVFVQLFNDPLITVSSFIGDLISIAGGENIASDVRGNAGLFNYEVLIYRNPDIVLIVGFSDASNLPDSIKAVREGSVYKYLNADIFLRPGPRAIDAIEQMNKIFYNAGSRATR